jgi:hypothetical protein
MSATTELRWDDFFTSHVSEELRELVTATAQTDAERN